MNKQRLIDAILTGFVFFSLSGWTTYAQSEVPAVEAGFHFSMARLGGLNFSDLGERRTEPGIGGRVTYNFNHHLSAEGEFSYFPRDNFPGGTVTQGLFGVKAGARSDKAGLFGKARPGLVRFSSLRFTVPCSPGESCQRKLATGLHTNFAFDVGGVFECYPSRRLVVRFDLGDTITSVRLGQRLGAVNPASTTRTIHSLQLNAGLGYRF